MAAMMCDGCAPSVVMALTVWVVMSAMAPLHPAWMAAMVWGVWVVEYDGYAVGGVDEEWCAWEVGDECVGVGERGYVVGVGDCGDVGGVGLSGYDEFLEGYAEVSGEECA